LKVITYNAYQEKRGRDPFLDRLPDEENALVCLQEVSPRRACWLLRRLGDRVFVSLARHGLQYLALVLPRDATSLARRTVQLNGYCGMLPAAWSVRRGYGLYRADRPRWRDCFEPRVAQNLVVRWADLDLQVINTHMPLEKGLRNRSFSRLEALLDHDDALIVGDLNAIRKDLFLSDLVLAGGLRASGSAEATHDSGRRLDYVLYRGRLREVGYAVEEGLSDHRLLNVELEVLR
jgi:endonuclease/exonuclease/phosphatase family metal-dependent hydrolase